MSLKIGTIKIGAVHVPVYEVPESAIPGLWGVFENGEIRLIKTLDFGQWVTTLYHEICHAALRLPSCQIESILCQELVFEERACESIGLVFAQNRDEIERMIWNYHYRSISFDLCALV